jgi:hypothetical protein
MANFPGEPLARVEDDHLQTLKARWDEAHAAGMAAMKRGDHRAAGEALRQQRDIIEQQRTLLQFRLSRVKSGGPVHRDSPDGSAVSTDVSPGTYSPDEHAEHVAWTLKKRDEVVQAVLRTNPDGTELRCVHQGNVLWTESFPLGHDPATLTLAIKGTLTSWLTKGFVRA